MLTIFVSNRTKKTQVLKSFDGDSINIMPMAQNVPVDEKFNWNLPRGVVLSSNMEKLMKKPSTNAGSAGGGVDGSLAFEAAENEKVVKSNQPGLKNDTVNAGVEAEQEARALQLEKGDHRIGAPGSSNI